MTKILTENGRVRYGTLREGIGEKFESPTVIIFLVFGSVFFNFFNFLRNKKNLATERNRSAEHSLGNPYLDK